MIKELAKHLESKTSLEVGTDLFAGFAPIDVDDAVILIETGGVPNFYLTDQKARTVQCLSKSRDYWTARANALAVYAALHGKVGISLPVIVAGETYLANTIEAMSEPQSLGQDERGLHVLSTNFVIRIKDANQ